MLSADIEEPLPDHAEAITLVPHYDCFVIGSRPREQLSRSARCTHPLAGPWSSGGDGTLDATGGWRRERLLGPAQVRPADPGHR